MSQTEKVFSKAHIRSLLSASKNDTGTKLLNLNSNIEDMFKQVDSALVSLTNRVTAVENAIKNIPDIMNFIQNARLFVDADGDLAQDDIAEEEEEENG